jgi:hypothetical protein
MQLKHVLPAIPVLEQLIMITKDLYVLRDTTVLQEALIQLETHVLPERTQTEQIYGMLLNVRLVQADTTVLLTLHLLIGKIVP